MDHPSTTGNDAGDSRHDGIAMRLIILAGYLLPRRHRQRGNCRNMQSWMADRTIQVNQQAGNRRLKKRCSNGAGKLHTEFQCTRVPAPMRSEQGFLPDERCCKRRRYPVATMLASDDDVVARRALAGRYVTQTACPCASTSCVTTSKRLRVLRPNAMVIGTSQASRPRAMTTRPMRGVLWRASKVIQRPPT